MIIAIHCWKLFSAQAMVLAVLVGATLSANLDSSSSLSKAKRLVVVITLTDRCGSFSAIRRVRCSSSGCGQDAGAATSALPGQPVQELVPRHQTGPA